MALTECKSQSHQRCSKSFWAPLWPLRKSLLVEFQMPTSDAPPDSIPSQHLLRTSFDVVKRWVNEAQEAASSDNVMVQVRT